MHKLVLIYVRLVRDYSSVKSLIDHTFFIRNWSYAVLRFDTTSVRYLSKTNWAGFFVGDAPKLISLHSILILLICCVSGCTVTSERKIKQHDDARVMETAEYIVDSFNSFLQRNEIKDGAIAISFKGKLVGTAGHGRTADKPARVASLSKAVTAVCVMKALEPSKYTVKTTLREIMPNRLSHVDAKSDYFSTISIEQLLTHTTGIRFNHLNQQGNSIGRYAHKHMDWQFRNIFNYQPKKQVTKKFNYANANYLILGMVIEKLTNTQYETYCSEAVFSPLGIKTAKLSTRWPILHSYGGWELSAADYLRFVDHYYTNDWRSRFFSAGNFKPADAGTKKYGLGVWMRESVAGTTFWHSGSFAWKTKERTASFASFFAVYVNGFAVSLNFSKDRRDGRGADLEKSMYNAVFAY